MKLVERGLVICRFLVVFFVYHGRVGYLVNRSHEWKLVKQSDLDLVYHKMEIIRSFILGISLLYIFHILYRISYHDVSYYFSICMKMRHCIQCLKLTTLHWLNVCGFSYREIGNSAWIPVAPIGLIVLIGQILNCSTVQRATIGGCSSSNCCRAWTVERD